MDQSIPNLERLCIDGDEHKLGQVFRNLLSNALKFTPVNGSVYLKVDSLESCDEEASEDDSTHSVGIVTLMWLTVSVTDTCPGISRVRYLLLTPFSCACLSPIYQSHMSPTLY
jgi:signal transduction histidine kinase